MGNHTFFLKEAISLVQEKKNIIRPANYSKLAPGRGSFVFNLKNYQIRITNLLGQTFMPQHVENPFLLLDEIVQKDESDFHFVDFLELLLQNLDSQTYAPLEHFKKMKNEVP